MHESTIFLKNIKGTVRTTIANFLPLLFLKFCMKKGIEIDKNLVIGSRSAFNLGQNCSCQSGEAVLRRRLNVTATQCESLECFLLFCQRFASVTLKAYSLSCPYLQGSSLECNGCVVCYFIDY